VEYRRTDTAWEALNVYSHRMLIHEEAEK